MPEKAKTSVSLVPIDFQSMQDKVYEQITQVLMRGGFEPGQKVSSRKLAAALGTSDMPVRAALGGLLAQGGLIQNASGTFSVPLISETKFREVMELRALLEGRLRGMPAAGSTVQASAPLTNAQRAWKQRSSTMTSRVIWISTSD